MERLKILVVLWMKVIVISIMIIVTIIFRTNYIFYSRTVERMVEISKWRCSHPILSRVYLRMEIDQIIWRVEYIMMDSK